MTLTVGSGPFGQRPAGHFNFDLPDHVVYVERFPRRVRAMVEGRAVVDSDRVVLVYESGRLPHYSFPPEDVRLDTAVADAAAPGHVEVAWDSVDAWFEEDEQVFVHVRDPYHRIDVVPTSRHVVVSIEGLVLAESARTRGLYESGLPVRWYMPADDVRDELLAPSETVTECAYKGTAAHWSARLGDALIRDVAWCYDGEVRREAEGVRGLFAFYNERVDIVLDDVVQERPVTPWSR